MPIITTNDGVRLSLVEKGRGRPLVLVPGWSQTARQFAAQIDGLADRYRVIAVDMRGHGQSEKPAHGYKIQRLAQDLKDVLDALDLEDAAVAGHSMGSSVLWCYWDLFGAHRIGSAIFIDQMPAITALPSWSDGGEADRGCDLRPRQPAGHDRGPGRAAGRRDDGRVRRRHVHPGLPARKRWPRWSSSICRCPEPTRRRCSTTTRPRTGAT